MRTRHVLTGFLTSICFVLIVAVVVLPIMLVEYLFGEVGSSILMILYLLFGLGIVFSYAAMLGDR